jgi:hypothetical protein
VHLDYAIVPLTNALDEEVDCLLVLCRVGIRHESDLILVLLGLLFAAAACAAR